MSQDYAKNYTHVAASQTDSAIVSGESCKVFGISVEGTAAGRVIVEEYGTSTVIAAIDVAANGHAELSTVFLAPRGLQITTPANVTCTVFHSNAGA